MPQNDFNTPAGRSNLEHSHPGRGYVFNFTGHGAFDPNGKIEPTPSQAEIDAHNAELARQEMAHMKQTGQGVLYIFSTDGKPSHAGTWASTPADRIKLTGWRKGNHNIAHHRLDVWFQLEGKTWHGVNIGDNDILRVKRCKK